MSVLSKVRNMYGSRRQLTHRQKSLLTTIAFYSAGIGAFATVALPSILPCPAYDDGRVALHATGKGDLIMQHLTLFAKHPETLKAASDSARSDASKVLRTTATLIDSLR